MPAGASAGGWWPLVRADPVPLTLYVTARCGFCALLKRYLDYRAIPYREVNVDLDEAAAEQLERWTGGYRTVPTVRIGERVLLNPRGPEVEAALASANAASETEPRDA